MKEIITHEEYILCELGLYNPKQKKFYIVTTESGNRNTFLPKGASLTFVENMKTLRYTVMGTITPQQLADDLSLYNKERRNEINTNNNRKG